VRNGWEPGKSADSECVARAYMIASQTGQQVDSCHDVLMHHARCVFCAGVMYDPHTPCTPLPTCPHEPLIQCTCTSSIAPGKSHLGQAPAFINPTVCVRPPV
jgi:hypothetical protein